MYSSSGQASKLIKKSQATMKIAATFALFHLPAFSCFLALYYLPVILYGMDSAIEDDRVALLFGQLLSRAPAQRSLALNIATHLLLVIGYYGLLSWLARRLAGLFKVSLGLLRTIVLILGWLLLVSGNAALFPLSTYTFSFPFLANPMLVIGLAVGLLVATLSVIIKTGLSRFATATTIGVTAGVWLLNQGMSPALGSASSSDRNVIIIGVDSLSFHALNELHQSLPTLNHLLNSGTNYQRAYTPFGRTFPAWLSILSGQQPATHGAMENLRNMNHVAKRNLLSTELQQKGFKTVFAIDERRFNNLDSSFGFDAVVGPEAGALDFVLQQFNDTPLTNLLLQLRIAKWLLPYSYINTESAANYDADGFVDNILSEVSGTRGLFLAVHFETAHFPFQTRHATVRFNTSNSFWNKYAAALTVVDSQAEKLLDGLREAGYLDNALLIVLSDHGEGLGEPEAGFSFGGEPELLTDYGHGTSVLSDRQNHIILGITEFRGGRPTSQPSQESQLVSLVDIRPLIENYLANGRTTIERRNACLLSETGLRFTEAADYKTLDEKALASSAAGFYEIDPFGRMQLREDQVEKLALTKDIGLRCPNHITYYSSRTRQFQSAVFDGNGVIRFLQTVPSDDIVAIGDYRNRLLADTARHFDNNDSN